MGETRLVDALRLLLAGWREDVGAAWQSVLADVEPDFDAVDPELMLGEGEVIFPGRKGQAPPGARPDAHIFRALDGIDPSQVAVVVIGQDPYTKVSQATGRAFEQVDLADWQGKPPVAPSLQRIIQAVALARTGDRRYVSGTAGWRAVVQAVAKSELRIAPPRQLWDAWQAQGVLFINAILTFNRFDPAYQFRGHQPLWEPVVRKLLGHLVRRTDAGVVFVTWGQKAVTALAGSGVEEEAKKAGTWGTTVRVVRGPHPNAPPPADPPFLKGADRMAEVTRALQAAGGRSLNW